MPGVTNCNYLKDFSPNAFYRTIMLFINTGISPVPGYKKETSIPDHKKAYIPRKWSIFLLQNSKISFRKCYSIKIKLPNTPSKLPNTPGNLPNNK